jgi:hypothetical protein
LKLIFNEESEMMSHSELAVAVATNRILMDLMVELENRGTIPRGHTQEVLQRSAEAFRRNGDNRPAAYIEEELIPAIQSA